MTSSLHYLLVDDDAIFLHVLSRGFSRLGYRVEMASTADQALARLHDQNLPAIDRMVLDLNLAGGSSLKALEAFLQAAPECQIVILTGYASIATTVEAMKRGAHNYLPKPVQIEDILASFEDSTNHDHDAQLLEETPLSVRRLEWEHIQRVLQEHEGNISATARALNMHRRTLQRKLQKRPTER